jgi:hypothetical protein
MWHPQKKLIKKESATLTGHTQHPDCYVAWHEPYAIPRWEYTPTQTNNKSKDP